MLRKIFAFLISVYQTCISPLFRAHCKYTPTCSAYCKEAILKYGVVKGGYLGIKRILRCNPWSKGGYDPVP